MTAATEPRVLQTLDGAPWDIDAYRKVGGYEAWKKCVKELSAKPGFAGEEARAFPLALSGRRSSIIG
jgi:hypothetical protein